MYSGIAYVAATIAFTVFGQLVLKWQMNQVGPMPSETQEKVYFLLSMFLRPWILIGFGSAFLASLAWMAAMTRFKLSDAYPFMSLAFVLVMILSYLFFGEALTVKKVAGTLIVIAGLIVLTR